MYFLFAPSITTDQPDVPTATRSTIPEPNAADEEKTTNNENGTRNEEDFVSLNVLTPMPSTSKASTREDSYSANQHDR